ncbi:transcriptional regulator with XRE-family HTH domain [Kitasatospora herbaricolor]|uniref:helix-turn-helix domain-containing protein n=1 Tax=Kitasatospora herbaricolor TaxID=68217 RepID=UPI001E4CFAA9|nr:helix-turn-helix transcriptional regulator [Kitasatospora herbaricolor]MDQ0313011.1 transcriptional regulator with XRE-family HTH domain [Kitasatospora herbaricolor]
MPLDRARPAPAPRAPVRPTPWPVFGARLRHWRRSAGLTQARLAALVGYDHTAISKLEHGIRRATPRLAARLDDLLGAEGDLLTAFRAAEEREERADHPESAHHPERADHPESADHPEHVERGQHSPPGPARPVRPPLPGWPAAEPARTALPPLGGLLPARLPDYGLLCPLHGASGCAVPPAADIAALHAEFCAAAPDSPPRTDADTVHALTGLLAVHIRAGEEHIHPGIAAAVEHTLRVIVRQLPLAPADPRRPLARLAAEYAHAAGVLRMQRGRNATAMACFDRALSWSELADDPATQVAALSDMSTLARLEGDAASALGYAREITRAAPGRHWAGAMAQVYQARAHALAGDVRETVRHVGRARLHLDHIGSRDESDAPWLTIASMHLRVESGAAAALRDAAAVVGDLGLARRALDAAGTALELLAPEQLPSARLLFRLRIADCHLCADDPQAALALLRPALEDPAVGVGLGGLPALVGHELRGLRDRLAARRGGPPELAAAARRLDELAR